MSTTGKHDAPRYATLRDYLRVVRRNRWLILVITVAFAAVAYALTSREKSTYQAQASVYFRDTTQDENLLGITTVSPVLPEGTRAQVNASAITRAPVVERAKAALHSRLSLATLSAPIVAFVDPQTAVVDIQARSPDPYTAQRLANAFAEAARAVGRDQARARFAGLASAAKAQYTQLSALARDALTRSIYANRIASLQFLAQTVDPVEIVQPAALPATPVSPRVVRNTILGLLLGLTVALIAAFIRDVLDRRLRGTAQIGEQLSWPILGHVRDSALGAGVFVDGNGRPPNEEVDRESFRMLRQNLRFLDVDNPPRSVVVTSALPAEGKSTVAAELACASAAGGVSTLLVECDLRRPSLAERFGISRTPGLSDFLLGEAKPAEIVKVVELPRLGLGAAASANGAPPGPDGESPPQQGADDVPQRLACITAGRPAPSTSDLLGSARFKAFLNEVTQAYDQVILDTSPLLSVADTTTIIPQADATLICVRAGRSTRDEAAALKQALDRLPLRLVGIVVTGVRPGADDDFAYYSYAYSDQA